MRRWALLPILLPIIAYSSYALNPPVGSSAFDRLASPQLLAGASSVAPSSFAAASSINPAASALASLPSLELNFVGLTSLSPAVSYEGTGVQAGGIFPTDYGVFGLSGRFLSSSSGLPFGTLGTANVSFAKAVYPNLLLGAGVGLVAGYGDHSDWGLGLNLGFISIPGSIGGLEDFSWGASIDTVGKSYAPFTGYSSFLPAFTPSVGAAFSLYKTKALDARISGSLTLPSFQDVRISLGGSISFQGVAALRLFTSVDVNDLRAGTQAFPLSGGIGFTFHPGARSGKVSEIQPSVAVQPLAANLYAGAAGIRATVGRPDTEPPKITVDLPMLSYISPNGNGVKDTLRIPLKITDNRFVAGYELVVRSAGGKVVRTIKSATVAVESTGAAGFLDRLLYANNGVPVPPDLVWNGANDQGLTVPDGTYTVTITAWDENGNRSTSAPYTVIVDTKSPTVDLVQPSGPPPIFSPNGDGYKDTLAIHQSGSKEPLWVGRFLDSAGRVVRTIEWKDSSPKSFVWDGRGNAGKVLPDGVYSYEIQSTDRAGNTAFASIPTIIIDTSKPAVRLDVTRDAISPGTSSPYQSMQYRFIVPQRNELVSWKLAITAVGGGVVRSVEGGAAMPDGFTFDGTDQQGQSLPDGVYHAELSVVYRNGAHSSAQAAAVAIDRVAPSASVATEYHVFSPIGSGTHSTMIFDISATAERLWTGIIATGGGKTVESFEWHGRPPATLSWNGRAPGGAVEPDGVYQFSISSTDQAGNYGQSNVASFVLDTQHKQLLLSTNYAAFSPNGRRHIIRIVPDVRSPKGFQSYRIDIMNRSGGIVGSFSGTGVPTGSFAWNGLGQAGQSVPAGEYRAVMKASYATGATITAETPWFTVVTQLPELRLSVDYHVFSPNGDGHRDTVTFTQSSAGGTSWVGRIVSQSGKTVVEHHWRGTLPATFAWNGRDSLGNIAANGTYSYELSATDPAGNVAQNEVDGIVLDNRPTQVYIDAGSRGFSPNGDGFMDTIAFSAVERPASGISSWRIDVLDAANRVVKSWSGDGTAPPASISWDGTTTAGGVAPDGSYHATLEVHYLKGDVDHAVTESFLLVAKPPVVRVALSPLPLLPPGSASAEPLRIQITAKSLDPVAHWKMQIYTPPVEEPFFAFSGEGSPPAHLRWDGKNAEGRAVRPNSVYSYHLTVVDTLGNQTMVTGNIPIGESSGP